MDWCIAYKFKPLRGTLAENLEKAGIEFFIPVNVVECLDGDRMVEKSEEVMRNLIFLHTDRNIMEIAQVVDGIRCPYMNRTTGKPAVVRDKEMMHFRKFLEMKNIHASFLPDAFSRFAQCPKVRVRAGEFAGLEGRVFRIRGDRKLVIALDDVAVAISGIHHTLLEVIG